MFSFLSNFVILKLLGHADALTICIFCFLICAAFGCLMIFIFKMRTFNARIKEIRSARARLHGVNTLEELALAGSQLQGTMPGKLIARSLVTVRKFLKAGTLNKPGLFSYEDEQVKNAITECLEELMRNEESFLYILKLSAEEGPLIGLFGTVWGLINAFSRISDRQTADIPTVAPGIAEALVITLAGLFVAIPALVYHVVVTQKYKMLDCELAAVADRIESIIESSLPRISNGGVPYYESSFTQKT